MRRSYTTFILLVINIFWGMSTPTGHDTKDIRKAQEYLLEYGYIDSGNSKKMVSGLLNDNELETALTRYQMFTGLPVTGRLDDKTMAQMKQPRCGIKDPIIKIKSRTINKKRYLHQGSYWRKEDLSWRIVNYTPDLPRATTYWILKKALSKWEEVTNIRFHEISSGNADILISFVRRRHRHCPYPFLGRGGTLAHAFYPMRNKKGLAGDVHFDDDEHFTHEAAYGVNLLWVAVHEIGHSLGLEHSNVREAVMFPYYKGYQGKDFDLKYDDILGIQSLYGSPVIKTSTPHQSTRKPGPTSPKSCLRRIRKIDAAFKTFDGKVFVTDNDKLYVLNTKMQVVKGPILVTSVFKGVDKVDAAYVTKYGRTVLIGRNSYWIFDKFVKVRGPRPLSQLNFGSQLKKPNAALLYPNRQIYLFKNGKYYRYDHYNRRIASGYPREMHGTWRGVPNDITAAVTVTNSQVYFFKGNQYWIFNPYTWSVKKGPRRLRTGNKVC